MNIFKNWSILPNKYAVPINSYLSNEVHQIMHLDDHQIFRDGIKIGCITPFFPNAIITAFDNGNDGLLYVVEQLQQKITIDCIITDINHPGIKGHHFIALVRHLEKLYHTQNPIPIIVISMVNDSTFMEQLIGKGKSLITNYFTKTTSPEIIVSCLQEILVP